MRAIYGKKLAMTRIFDKKGFQIPVTLVKILDNIVTQVLESKDGKKIQISAGNKKRLNKPEKGQFESFNIKPLKSYQIKSQQEFKVKDKIGIEIFQEGEKVNVTSTSRGKGFTGTVKRHGFHLGPKTHGSDNYRQPGSIGSMFPQRVIKGKKMPGHMGAKKTTIKNLKIIRIEPQNNLIYLKGALPGIAGSGVLVWSQNES